MDAVTPSDVLMLAARYRALGLPAAARGALLGLVDTPSSPGALLALGELDLEAGDLVGGAEHVTRALLLAGPEDRCRGRLLAAEIALASGDLGGADGHLDALLAEIGIPATLATRGYLGRAAVALRRGDGAAADEALEAAFANLGELEARSLEELGELAAVAGGHRRWSSTLGGTRGAAGRFVEALLLGEQRAAEEVLEEAGEGVPEARLNLALRLARRRGRDRQARHQAIAHLEGLLEGGELLARPARARVELLLASLHDDEEDSADLAEAGYRRALPELPRDGTACNNLGVIALRAGDLPQAEEWFLRALVAEPQHQTAYRNLARVLHGASSPQHLAEAFARLEAAGLGARALAELAFALVEVAREDAHQGIAAKGHQLKNLLGVLGSRLRSIARRSEGEHADKLNGLHQRLTAVYDEWAAYLRTLREEIATVDPIDINALAAEAAHQIGAPVRLRLADGLPEVRGLRAQLLEALVNLLRNAVEAAGEGPEVLVVSEELAHGRAVQLSVIDAGPGIPRSELRRVRQAGYTTKSGGSGLGLSLCERIVQAHGGRLEIDSTPGEGTAVRLWLPVHLESQTRHGMLQSPLARVLRAAAAEEYVVED